MRAAAWIVILATVLGGIAIFLPSLELRFDGAAVSRRTQVSLYKVAHDRALVRKLIATYHRSEKRKVGDRLIHAAAPHVDGELAKKLGRVRDTFDDTRDAMDALDGASDEDVHAAATLFTILLGTLLGLDVLLICVVAVPLIGGQGRRGGGILRIAIAFFIAGISAALCALCRFAAWEANDEIGHSAVAITAGAYVLPAAAVIGLVAAIVHEALLRSRR